MMSTDFDVFSNEIYLVEQMAELVRPDKKLESDLIRKVKVQLQLLNSMSHDVIILKHNNDGGRTYTVEGA